MARGKKLQLPPGQAVDLDALRQKRQQQQLQEMQQEINGYANALGRFTDIVLAETVRCVGGAHKMEQEHLKAVLDVTAQIADMQTEAFSKLITKRVEEIKKRQTGEDKEEPKDEGPTDG